MHDQILKFYARDRSPEEREAGHENASVPCPHAADASPMRRTIVGKKHAQVKPGQWGLVADDFGSPYVGKFHHDLVRACKEGDLWAADADTARICGVPFDPTFGGAVKAESKPDESTPDTDASSDR